MNTRQRSRKIKAVVVDHKIQVDHWVWDLWLDQNLKFSPVDNPNRVGRQYHKKKNSRETVTEAYRIEAIEGDR